MGRDEVEGRALQMWENINPGHEILVFLTEK